MIHLVALLARAGHGKTTVANHLREQYGTEIVSLAAPLKKIAKVVMNFSDSQLYGTQEEKERVDPRYGMSARAFLQKLGTEGIRENLGPDTWLEALVYNITKRHEADPSKTVFVVDDVRFQNEVRYLRNLTHREGMPKFFSTVIKLVCTDAPPSGNDNHPSEAEIDQVREHLIDGVAVSSRSKGTAHLIKQVEGLIDTQPLRGLRVALVQNRKAA